MSFNPPAGATPEEVKAHTAAMTKHFAKPTCDCISPKLCAEEQGTLLEEQLVSCEHKLVSVGTGDLKTCFDCGSTKRDGETAWLSPWIWRKK